MKLLAFLMRYILFCYKAIYSDITNSYEINTLIKKLKEPNIKKYTDCIKIEDLRRQLLNSEKEIQINDFGAGSNINIASKRKIKDITRNSAKSQKFGRLLYKIVTLYKPQIILELGTSLGISTCYLAEGNKKAEVITLEGCKNTSEIAKNNFEKINKKNIKLILGNFNDTLQEQLSKLKSIDLAFIDGNHQEKPTIEYFEKILKYSHEKTIFIFDDIHWSNGMEKAWKHIIQNKKVSLSIDLFFVGIVFINPELEKANSFIRF